MANAALRYTDETFNHFNLSPLEIFPACLFVEKKFPMTVSKEMSRVRQSKL
jgi:hypothetical protein